MALTPGQDVSKLSPGELYAYPVDTGTGYFADPEAARAINAATFTELYGPPSPAFVAMQKNAETTCDAVKVDTERGSAVVFGAGWGDGSYASYFGLDAQGKPVVLVTDFQVLDWVNGFPEEAEGTADASHLNIRMLPNDINAEAHANLQVFALTQAEAKGTKSMEVVATLQRYVEQLNRSLRALNAPPMVFYCWHDEQAGQLRFSLVSASHGRLPFDCKVNQVADPYIVVSAWLTSPYLDELPGDKLELGNATDVTSDIDLVLDIWVQRLPGVGDT